MLDVATLNHAFLDAQVIEGVLLREQACSPVQCLTFPACVAGLDHIRHRQQRAFDCSTAFWI